MVAAKVLLAFLEWCRVNRWLLVIGAVVTLLFDVNGGLCFMVGVIAMDEFKKRTGL